MNIGKPCSNKYLKKSILHSFVEQHKNLAPQGSIGWHFIRSYTIGGSEIATVIGENPYSKPENLVAQKVGLSEFKGNIACRWGKLFENITSKITQKLLGIDYIYNLSSLEGEIDNQRYSPDGLALYEHVNHLNEKSYSIILFEFKSPYSTIPNGFIPKHYLPQVKTGLCSIPIVDYAIFINNMFRKCSFNDLNTTLNYDKVFHNKDKCDIDVVLSLGLCMFYQTAEQKTEFLKKYTYISNDEHSASEDEFYKMSDNIHEYGLIDIIHNYINGESTNIDFGNCRFYDFDKLLLLYDEDLISIEICDTYISPHYVNEFNKKKYDENVNEFIDNYKHKIATNHNIGFMPWKLFKSDFIKQNREPKYLKSYEYLISDIINIINDINKSQNSIEKLKRFKSYFPKSRIKKI